jgi:uncharacterized protein YjaG (DUF416 family)
MLNENIAHVLRLSAKKKLAFLMFLYTRMLPELHSFCVAENLDFSCFQRAGEEFWQALMDDKSSISWVQLREDILNATPDSEDFGSLTASFALNAAFVAADIAGFLADGQDDHIIEPIGYAQNSLGAYVIDKLGAVAYDRTIDDYVEVHPLVQRERQAEKEDIDFLTNLQDAPWPENIFSMLQNRAETQHSLLDNT